MKKIKIFNLLHFVFLMNLWVITQKCEIAVDFNTEKCRECAIKLFERDISYAICIVT